MLIAMLNLFLETLNYIYILCNFSKLKWRGKLKSIRMENKGALLLTWIIFNHSMDK